VFTASTKTELDKLFDSRPVKSRLAILIDFGIIVSQSVIDYFELGIINSHFSLLPEWRGADPITFSILSGQPQTGVSLMLLTVGMDEGPLLGQATYDIEPTETTPSLTDALIELSHKSIQHVVPLYLDGSIKPAPQSDVTLAAASEPTYSRKLTKQDGILDFQKAAVQLEREVRAYLDWPKSKTQIGDLEVTVTKAHASIESGEPGGISISPPNLMIHTTDGTLVLDEVKPAGKQAMSVAEFLRGYGARLSN
jgi:methionyl-tRNA formyltransferase